ncbi:hypothetical protein B0T20DRAFT_485244 [Sordaria brevicollis]|uniref:Conserved oligomeric Golgi complex subunit 2 n=1 Tax=Sordaria brevicollis TaxID=83679 RepID=A0AAE0UFT7_SORBR|nr:hypothetical protein B0T20DRAFT_485244 [Sordaria brevicollis]
MPFSLNNGNPLNPQLFRLRQRQDFLPTALPNLLPHLPQINHPSAASIHHHQPRPPSSTAHPTHLPPLRRRQYFRPPLPPTLPRPSFLTPSFSPLSYLNSLYSPSSTTTTPRHQTLPDLHHDLHTRSLSISSELLELINANYTSFLSLGDELKGGEERVEDVRVGVLGFKRAVEEGVGVGEGGVGWGRGVLEWGEGVEGLEMKLNVNVGGGPAGGGGAGMGGSGSGSGSGGTGTGAAAAGVEGWVKRGMPGQEDLLGEEEDDEYAGWDDGSEDFKDEILLLSDDTTTGDDDDREGFMSSSPAELEALAREYVRIENMADRLGGANEVPFVRKMEERMIRCRNTILLDLSTALKEARRVGGERGKRRVVRYLGVYRLLDAEQEAVRVLKEK